MASTRTHKRVKIRCTKTKIYLEEDLEEAKAHLKRLKERGFRGDSRLRIYKCAFHSKSMGKTVLHVGHLEVKV